MFYILYNKIYIHLYIDIYSSKVLRRGGSWQRAGEAVNASNMLSMYQ